MGRERDLHEHDDAETDARGRQARVIARDDAGLFQRGTAARALRCGEPDPFGEIVVGQAAVLLQRVQ